MFMQVGDISEYFLHNTYLKFNLFLHMEKKRICYSPFRLSATSGHAVLKFALNYTYVY